ncbi:MAG TPA: histidine--tRNA ligase [Verrucomicrobiae bacterium]|nr:histidine--tRNA ligase [Verrucomicrobiae bacterium]
MGTVQPRTPSGFPEYLPQEQLEFNRLLAIIRDTYERYGFSPIDTPDLELSEVLLTKSGGETEQQVYRFQKGSNDLTMRFDLTVPLARYTAQHEGQLIFPFRRYHIGKVHRGERAQAGRFREFYQCDIDIIGSESPIVDAEFPAVINEIFEQFNFGEFTIRINNRLVLNGFFEGIGLAETSKEVLRIIDKIEKISREELVQELHKLGLSNEQTEAVLDFTAISGTNDEILSQLQDMEISAAQFKDGLAKLTQVVKALRVMQVPERRFQIDLKIARGLDYYTGTVYETTLNDYPELGSVCSGGRYDNLASHYTNTKLPGVGISIGLSRLFYKLRELGVINAETMSPASIVVMPLSEQQVPTSLTVAHNLRTAGHAVVLYSEPNAIKKKLRYADRMGFTWAVIIGDQEVSSGTVSLKQLAAGTSEVVAMNDLVARIEAED